MKKTARNIVIALAIAILVVAGIFGVKVAMGSPYDERVESIRAGCRASQTTMQQLAKSDQVLRANRGPALDGMRKLMFAMNARLAANNKSALILNEKTDAFDRGVTAFASDFLAYDDALSRAIKIDCKEKTLDFYEAVVEARTRRSLLYDRLDDLDKLINDYRTEFENIWSEK